MMVPSMTDMAPITHKLDPLIRSLASDKDGEVIACVRAISHQLDKAGLDFHDLADRLTSAPEPPADDDETVVFYDYLTACEWILRTDCGELSANDIRFAESMRSILYRFPPRPKQAEWLRSLVAKLGGCFHE